MDEMEDRRTEDRLAVETEVPEIRIDIDGRTYPLRRRTARAERRLRRLRRVRDPYRRKRAVLRLLLGRRAARALLREGRNASLDRLDRLADGALRAWRFHAEALRRERLEARARELEEALAPLMRALDRLEALYGAFREDGESR